MMVKRIPMGEMSEIFPTEVPNGQDPEPGGEDGSTRVLYCN